MNYNHYLGVLARQVDNRNLTPEELSGALGTFPMPGDPVAVPDEFVVRLAEEPILNSRGHYVSGIPGNTVPGFTLLTMCEA